MKFTLLVATLLCCTLMVVSAHASSPAGFDEYYRVKAADINGDGLQDLYVYSTPKIVMLAGDIATPIVTNSPPAVANFALLQQADGSFTIDGNLTPAELDLAKNAAPLSVDLKVADYNADGLVDLFTGRLNLFSGFSNAKPAFVFAPTTAGAAPTQIATVDKSFIDFFVQASGMIADSNYIKDTQLINGWYTESGTPQTGYFTIDYINSFYVFQSPMDPDVWVTYLGAGDDPNDPNNVPQYCQYYAQSCTFDSDVNDPFYGWEVYGSYLANIQLVLNDPATNFNHDALTFSDNLSALQAGSNTVSTSALEGVLGVPVGGAFAKIAQTSSVQSQLPQSDYPFIDTMISFGNVAAAIFNDIDVEDVKNTAEIGAEIFVPGFDLYVCATEGGCSNFDIAVGVIGVIPGGKVAADALKVGKVAIKVGRVGGKLANDIGKAGEDLVRAAYPDDIGPKITKAVKFNDVWILPDGLTTTRLSEVKNRAQVSFTKQLRDYLDYAKQKGLEFDLYVRGTDGYNGSGAATRSSWPLKDAYCAGNIILKAIPDTGPVQLPTCPQ